MNVPEPFAVAWLVVAGIACIVILMQRRKIEALEDFIDAQLEEPIEQRQWLDDLSDGGALVYCVDCGFEHSVLVDCADSMLTLAPIALDPLVFCDVCQHTHKLSGPCMHDCVDCEHDKLALAKGEA